MVRDHPAAGQTYRERRPAPALDGVVSAVWVQQISPGAGPYTQRNLPDGSVELVCKLGATPRIVGPRTHPMVEILAPGTTVVGARFHPGAASSVPGVPASELVDSTVMSDDLWGSSAVAIGELVDSSASPAEAVAVLQRRIIARLTDALPRDPIVTETVRLLLGGGMDEIGSLASSLSISERQLRRRCQAGIGLAPKVLHRILRFHTVHALAQQNAATLRKPAGDGLARLAADAGYADQAHLTRECRRLTGLSPRSFLDRMEHHCAAEHDHAASYQPLLEARRRDDRSVQDRGPSRRQRSRHARPQLVRSQVGRPFVRRQEELTR